MLKHCSDSWSLFSFSPQSDRQQTDTHTAQAATKVAAKAFQAL